MKDVKLTKEQAELTTYLLRWLSEILEETSPMDLSEEEEKLVKSFKKDIGKGNIYSCDLPGYIISILKGKL